VFQKVWYVISPYAPLETSSFNVFTIIRRILTFSSITLTGDSRKNGERSHSKYSELVVVGTTGGYKLQSLEIALYTPLLVYLSNFSYIVGAVLQTWEFVTCGFTECLRSAAANYLFTMKIFFTLISLKPEGVQ